MAWAQNESRREVSATSRPILDLKHPVGVDQGEEGNGNLTDLRCEKGDFVVVGLGRRIENTERAEQGDACGVVGGNGRRHHAVSGKSLSRRRAGATSHTVGEKIPL